MSTAVPASVEHATELVDRVHRQVLAARSHPDAATIAGLVRRIDPLLPEAGVAGLVAGVLARVAGLGPLEPLLADPAVSEVMVNGGGSVWIERGGRIERTDLRLDRVTVEGLVERIVAPLGLRVDRTVPMVDARLPDGSRVNAVVPPLAVDGPCLTIRRFAPHRIELEEITSPAVAALLRWAVAARANVIVSGGTGVGKTTVLNALAGGIPLTERVVTIEDTAELRLPGDHVVRLEARPANADGVGAVSVRDLVRNALRMRPDRIVVGEVRGAESLDMLQAMNTGHEGSLSTCHANSPVDALRRLETMALMADIDLPLAAVRDQLHAAVDLVVHLGRRADGGREVKQVAEVCPADSSDVRRTVTLAADGRVRQLPTRLIRSVACPAPDPAWLIEPGT